MRPSRLAAFAAGIILAFTGTASAHATQVIAHPSIYASNNGHNPGTLTVSCDNNTLTVHTTLWADQANIDQTVKVYREDTNALVFGPVTIPAGGHLPAAFLFFAGVAYDAVAVPSVDSWPTSTADLIARLTAKPPTADNSQLLVSMMPTPPTGCVLPPPPNPCLPHVGNDLAATATATCPPCPKPDVKTDTAVVVPTCVPTSEPTSKPSTKPSTSASTSATSASSSPSTSATSVATATAAATSAVPSPTGSATTAPSTGGLAHTGASVVPYAAGALLLLATGGGFLFYGRRARRH